eukprot:TRINITY_DN10745_c0_g1_i3.p1 TRINITY_DN10745_c0_g1~~TRINITY_DN10745_c0_g1_i3.p1  ORF type:complete len:325 (-),score=97.59 TRINITY_DN10745_c0_g1_i3:90-938(-)
MEDSSDFIEKASYTDVLSADRRRALENPPKHTEKPKAPLLNAQPAIEGPLHKEVIGNESFSFEKAKIQQLRIESIPPMDVNDESITKLKAEIFGRLQAAMEKFEKISNITRTLTVIFLFIEILEMIGMFFMLLYLSLKMIPTEQIFFWLGSSLGFSLAQIFLLIKGIVVSQSKESKPHKDFLLTSAVFFVLLLIAIIVYSKVIFSAGQLFGEQLEDNAREGLQFAQLLMFVQAVLKAACQFMFFVCEGIQVRNLKAIDQSREISVEPQSQNYMLENQLAGGG